MSGRGDVPSRRPLASPDDLPPLRDVIAAHGLRAKKSLSQNFLLDLNLTRKIARAGGKLEGKTVVEIGPGPGGLTRALFLEGADNVIAVERDERCIAPLIEIADRYPGRLELHNIDALQANWRQLCASAREDVVIASNLPYSVATMLLVSWLEGATWPPWYGKMVLMFQREVAQRIVAQPGTKSFGRLSVLSQWRTRVTSAFNLKPEAFLPPPKVASTVVVFEPRQRPHPACSVRTLGNVTRAAFGQRRKMLRQSLKSLTPEPEYLLDAAGISQTLRAEALSVNDFARLAYIYDRLADRR